MFSKDFFKDPDVMKGLQKTKNQALRLAGFNGDFEAMNQRDVLARQNQTNSETQKNNGEITQ